MARITANPLCVFCAVEMVLKTVFGKQIYECPKCKRRVPVADIVNIEEAPNE